MNKLSSKTIKGVLIASGVATAAVGCTLAVKNNIFKPEHLLVVNDVEELKNANILEEAENQVKEAQAKVEEADKELAKATNAKEEAQAEVQKAEEAIEKAQNAKSEAQAQLKAAKTEAERKAAEEKVKAVEAEIKKAESTKKTAEAKVQTASENVKKAENAKVEAENNVKAAEDNKKMVEEHIKKEAEAVKEEIVETVQASVKEEKVHEQVETSKKTVKSTQSTAKQETKQSTVTEPETNSNKSITDEQWQKIQEALARDNIRKESNSCISVAENALKDLGDKISKADKEKAEGQIAALKKALEGSNIDDIKAKMEVLNKTATDLDAKVKQEADKEAAEKAAAEERARQEREAWEANIKKQSDIINGHYKPEYTPSAPSISEEEKRIQALHRVIAKVESIVSKDSTITVNRDIKEGTGFYIWWVEMSCDLSKCVGFNSHSTSGKISVRLDGARDDVDSMTLTAPEAKAGYKFVGWKKYTVKYVDSSDILMQGYEAVYEPFN